MVNEHTRARWAGPHAYWRHTVVAGMRVRWVEAGSGSPVLLLHGYGGSAHWWLRNIAALARTHRVLALDVPGFGRSGIPGNFTFAGVADLLAQWIEQQGIPPADVVAHSMGGQLAIILAARHPTLLRSLVLAAPAGLPFDMGLPGIARRAMRSRRGGDPRFTSLVLLGVTLAGPRVLWQAVQQIRFVDVREHLAAIAVPTLILWGEHDGLISPIGGPILAAAMPNARLTIVPEGRHNLMWEQAPEFNRIVSAFLREHPQGEPGSGRPPLALKDHAEAVVG